MEVVVREGRSSSEEEMRKAVKELWEEIQRDPNWRKIYEILAEL